MESNKEKNFISAVVYCSNDEKYICKFIRGLNETLKANFLKYEIIVVNDASTDHSINIVRDYVKKVNADGNELTVNVLNMSYYQGLESSMNAGVNLSIGDFVYEFDSVYVDYDWDMLMKVYYYSLTGCDIVSAKIDSMPRFTSRVFYRLFNRYANLQHKIGMETFRILSRRAINRIHSITQTIPFRKAAYANCGLAINTLSYKPVGPVLRKYYGDRKNVAIDSLILFTDVAFRATVYLAILMFVIALAVGVYAVIYKILENPVEGWTATTTFLSFGFAGLFAILAMIIKYLQTIVNMIFRKKNFLFESIEKLQ